MMPPREYSEWIACIEAIKSCDNDEAVMAAMELGSISWSSGVAERLVTRLFDLINYRLDLISKQMQRGLDCANADEMQLVQVLIGTRKKLGFLRRFARLNALPENVKTQIAGVITRFADNAQASLESSASIDRTGKLKVTIRNNPLNKIEEPQKFENPPEDDFYDFSQTTIKAKRKVILT